MKSDPVVVNPDKHPCETSLASLPKLKAVVRADGTVTAGNAGGVPGRGKVGYIIVKYRNLSAKGFECQSFLESSFAAGRYSQQGWPAP
jgi:hypothetical protein